MIWLQQQQCMSHHNSWVAARLQHEARTAQRLGRLFRGQLGGLGSLAQNQVCLQHVRHIPHVPKQIGRPAGPTDTGCVRLSRPHMVRHHTLLHEHFEHSIFGVAVTRAFARHAVLSGTSRHNQVEVRLFLFPNGHVRRECTMVRHRHGRRQDALDLVRHGDSPAAAGRAGSGNTYTCTVNLWYSHSPPESRATSLPMPALVQRLAAAECK